MADHRDTLILPFHREILPLPKAGENWILLNADLLPSGSQVLRNSLTCEQGFRPKFLALEGGGYRVQPRLEIDRVDTCLILADRVRAINEFNLTRAWNATKPGGLVVYSGDKKLGVQSVRKWVSSKTEIEGSLSKNHAVVFWVRKSGGDWPLPDLNTEDADYTISSGMFSADGPDVGSGLLAEQFDQRIFGRVADFGSGWGYLSAKLMQRAQRVEQVELFEADWASLEAAKINVGNQAIYHWVDLTLEPPRGPFNWVIMNPPFHQGRAANPELGIAFIRAAAKVLPAGGRLLMVANTNLPYENPLSELFKSVERKAQANGFKVIEAVKGSR